MDLRTEVTAFAEAMERQLQENEWKGGWLGEKPYDLLYQLQYKVVELGDALTGHPEQAKVFASDIANYAMMLFDQASKGKI